MPPSALLLIATFLTATFLHSHAAGTETPPLTTPWDSCFRVFVPTPSIGELEVFILCVSRSSSSLRSLGGSLGHLDDRSRAIAFFAKGDSAPSRAFWVTLDEKSECTQTAPLLCRLERWTSRERLDPQALLAGEIRSLGADPRTRVWALSPGAFTQKLTPQGMLRIEATPQDQPESPPRVAEARWERL